MSHNKKFYAPSPVLLPQKNLLQLACTYGDLPFIESLLKSGEYNVDEPDQESNTTALHSSVYHRLLGVSALLTAYGARWDCEDFDGCSVLDYLNDNRKKCALTREKYLLYSWGNNFTFNLGIETGDSKHVPSLVKGVEKLSVKKIVVRKYHSVILDTEGRVHSCGMGEGGRLGHGNDETYLSFKIIESTCENIIDICAGNFHTFFLSDQGSVYSCGINDFGQLGLGNTTETVPTHSLFPTKLNHKDIRNLFFSHIACGNFHSVMSTNQKLYTFGRNFGQLGYPLGKQGQVQYIAKVVTSLSIRKETDFVCLSACDAVTTGVLSNNTIFVCENFHCKLYNANRVNLSLAYSKTFYFTELSSHGLVSETESVSKHAIQFDIVLLDNFNSVWRFSAGSLSVHLCRFNNGYDIKVSHFALGKSLFLVSVFGEVFQCKLPPIQNSDCHSNKPDSSNLLEKAKLQDIANPIVTITRIHLLHNIIKIFTDTHCENFFASLTDPVAELLLLPRISTSTYQSDLKARFSSIQSNPPNECIKIESEEGEIIFIDSFIFYSFLSAVQGITCNSLTEFPFSLTGNKLTCPLNYQTIYSIFETAYFQRNELPQEFPILYTKLNSNFPKVPTCLKTLCLKPRILNFSSLPELHDTVINCVDDESFKCHKCILVARSEYFSSMLSLGWQESSSQISTLNLKFTLLVVQIIIKYIYTDLYPESIHEYSLYQLLIASDHFLLPRLKEWTEYKIALSLTVDSVVPVLELSRMYSAHKLTVSCIEFICINFGWLISKRELESLDLDVLALISDCATTRARTMGLKERVIYKYDHYTDLVEEFLANEICENKNTHREVHVKSKTKRYRKSNSRVRTVSEGSSASIEFEENSLSSSPKTLESEPWKPNWLLTMQNDNSSKEDNIAKIPQDFNAILLEERTNFLQIKRTIKPDTSKPKSISHSAHMPQYISWGISNHFPIKKKRSKAKRNSSESEVKKRERTWSAIDLPTNISFEDIYRQQLTSSSPEPVLLASYNTVSLYENSNPVCTEPNSQINTIPQPRVNNIESIVIEEQAIIELTQYYEMMYPFEQFIIDRELGNVT